MNTSEQANVRRLQGILAQKVAAAAGEIAPELFDYIGGDSEEAIDRSIELAKQKSAQLVQRAMQQQARPSDVDPTWAAGNREGFGDQQLADQVAAMSMQEYGRQRQNLGVHRDLLSFLGGS